MAVDDLVECLTILSRVADSVNMLKSRTKNMGISLSDLVHEAQIKSFITDLQYHTKVIFRLNKHLHNLQEMLKQKPKINMHSKEYEMICVEIDNAINTMRNSARHINECTTKVNFYLDGYKT